MSLIKLEQVQFTGVPRPVGAARVTAAVAAPAPAVPAVAGAAPRSDELPRLRAEIEGLRGEIDGLRRGQHDALERQRQQARAELIEAVARARAEGIEEGSQRAARDDAARVAALGQGVTRALDGVQAAQAAIEELALGVARLALRSLLGDAEWRSDALVRSVRQACSGLQGPGRPGVRLSAQDLVDADELRQRLAQALPGGIELSIDTALAAGSCVIELDGQALDAALPGQLARLERLLAQEAARG